MTTSQAAGPAMDTGAGALAVVLQLLGLPANPGELLHQSGYERLDGIELERAARRFPVRAKTLELSLAKAARAATPFAARMRDGDWIVVARFDADKVLIQHPNRSLPELVSMDDLRLRWGGRVLLLSRRAPLNDPHRRFNIGWFLGAVQKYRRPVIEVLIGSFFIQLFALLTPLFFQVVIDKVFVNRGLSTLQVLAVGLAGLSVFEVILSTLRTYLLAHTSNRIDVELGARLFRHLVSLPFAYFQSRRVGDTIARVRELDSIRQFLTSAALTLAVDLFFALVFLVVLLFYSVKLTLIVAVTLPLYAGLSLVLTPTFKARLQERFQRGSDNQSFLVETVGGVETIKSMALEPVVQRRWEDQLAAYVAASFRVVMINNVGSQAASFINKIMVVAILYFGAQLVIKNTMTVGELVAFNMLSSQLAAPVLRIAQIWQDFQQTRISIDRVGDILNTTPEPGSSGQSSLAPLRGDIALETVSFRYRIDAHPAIQDLSVAIPAGQVIGVVGSSGSGKSTLAKLIQRLYVPERGRITVDGNDLSVIHPSWLRRQIGVVLQENVLFNISVRQNIALAQPGLGLERIIEAAELAGAHEFITALPEGYDTIIGERGSSLSGGQRQRIAIARALIGDPRILIFDEATSALDYESEAAIQANMFRICKGRTVILIAHRLSTLRNADRILTLDKGRLIEDGSHEQLLAANGRYATLWRLQAGLRPDPETV
jgi:subfamily B ATP-binding cassette protein HlyB/CyaB